MYNQDESRTDYILLVGLVSQAVTGRWYNVVLEIFITCNVLLTYVIIIWKLLQVVKF